MVFAPSNAQILWPGFIQHINQAHRTPSKETNKHPD